ncbi:MAG: hypothetical protein C4297_14455 [Gemmataceae bacterium]
MTRLEVYAGTSRVGIDLEEGKAIAVHRQAQAPVLEDVAGHIYQALEAPLDGYPPLRRALTADDRVVIVVNEALLALPILVQGVADYLLQAGIARGRIRLLCAPRLPGIQPRWFERLPGHLRQLPVEVHDPHNRARLCYLASTQKGRRIYLNRSLVEADAVVVIGRTVYDPIFGYAGGSADLFPALGDSETREQLWRLPTENVPGDHLWPILQEADEVAWLLGVPFFVQGVEGPGDELSHILAGLAEPVARASRKLLDRYWRVTVAGRAELVIAGIGGDPAGQSFVELARAFACAARIVQPGGHIAVVSALRQPVTALGEWFRDTQRPLEALVRVRRERSPLALTVWQLAVAAERAHLYLLSDLDADQVEQLHVTPLRHAADLQRLAQRSGTCIVLPDAHKTMALTGPDLAKKSSASH